MQHREARAGLWHALTWEPACHDTTAVETSAHQLMPTVNLVGSLQLTPICFPVLTTGVACQQIWATTPQSKSNTGIIMFALLESWNHLCWKRCLKSSSPTFNLELPSPLLKNVTTLLQVYDQYLKPRLLKVSFRVLIQSTNTLCFKTKTSRIVCFNADKRISP